MGKSSQFYGERHLSVRALLAALIAIVLVATVVYPSPLGLSPAGAEVPATTGTTLFSEGFNTVGVVPPGWTATGGFNIDDVTSGPGAAGIPGPHSGAGFAVKETAGGDANLVSPVIDLTNAIEPYLDFWLHSYDLAGIDSDPETPTIELDVRDDNGVLLDTVFGMGDTDLSGANGWIKFRVRLADFAGQLITLDFHVIDFNPNSAHDIGIDDIEVFDADPVVAEGLTNPVAVTFYNTVPALSIDAAHQSIFPSDAACRAIGSIDGELVHQPITTITSITITQDATEILYDHHEDGLGNSRNRTQWSTELWGDGDLTNGFPFGHPTDLLNQGDVIVLQERIDPDFSDTVLQYDGGDRFTSAEGLVVTKIGWNDGSSTLLAGATEVFDTSRYGREFVMPVGEDTVLGGTPFEYVGASITSAGDNNVVTLPDASTVTLQRGETHYFDGGVDEGDTIIAALPITVALLTGDVCSTFEGRWFSLLPTRLWSDEYYTPVSSASDDTPSQVHFFNPSNSAITVDIEFGDGNTTSRNVPPGGSAQVTMRPNTGAKFTSDQGDFYAVQTYDTGDTTRDWGFALLPINELSPVIKAGFAPGTDPSIDSNSNTSPLWVTAINQGTSGATSVSVCVDWDGDSLPDPPGYDTVVNVGHLESQKLKDPDNDNTGAVMFVCNPADPTDPGLADWVLAGAWGQESNAPGASPSIDVGHGLLNLPSFDIEKNLVSIDDDNNNGVNDVGDTVQYELVITNESAILIARRTLTVSDELPSSVDYVEGSAQVTLHNGTTQPIPDDIVGPATTEFPLDVLANNEDLGYIYPLNFPGNQSFTVTFEVEILHVPPNNVVVNTACVTDDRFRPCDTVNFEVPEFGSIGNRVWLDEDGDGVQDAGEDGIANVEVTLTDSQGNTVTTFTDSDGGYLFTDLPVGDYTVTIAAPAGMDPTFDEDGGLNNTIDVTLSPPTNPDATIEHDTADFGLNWVPPTNTDGNTGVGAIGDRIWSDADGDGVQDPGEPGIAGVTVNLFTDPDGDGVYDTPAGTTVTDAAGNYIFDDLPAGAYSIEAVAPAGHTQTGDPDGTLDNLTTSPIVLAPGDVYTNVDFGYQPDTPNTIGDTVWFDGNGDGVVDPNEPGIAGVTVALLDVDGNIIATTTTDENGNYEFVGVPDGTFTVWVNDTNNVLREFAAISDPDGTLDSRNEVSVAGGQTIDTADFGYAPPLLDPEEGLISDTVFLDFDGDGSADPGEGIEGVRVELFDEDGRLVGVTWTNENGLYAFGDLVEGEYLVKIDTTTLPPGVTNTIDPDDFTANESSVSLAVNEQIYDQDFGYTAANPAEIGGTIWHDTDADGTLDEPGNGLAGVTVSLFDDEGKLVATTTTDASGNYSFPGLPAGTYTVDVTDEDNVLGGWWHSDGPNAGADNNSQTDPYTVTVAAGQTDTTGDFGYYVEPGSVGNAVWEDTDGNGIKDGGEPPIEGAIVTLEITYPDGTVITMVEMTDAAGEYSFDNLLLDEDYNGDPATAGAAEPSYSLSVELPAGFENFGSTHDGTDDSTGIDAGTDNNADDPAGEPAFPAQSATDNTNDFGYQPLGVIGDFVWNDLNGDGLQDLGEPGLEGWTVTLTLPDGSTVVQQTTDGTVDLDGDGNPEPAGSYLFTDLPEGDYTVTVTPPAGWSPTFDPDGGFNNTADIDLGPGETNLDQDFGYGEPEIEIEKSVYSGQDAGAGCLGGELVAGANGDLITYCFEVTNTGSVTLAPVTIDDADLAVTDTDMTVLSGDPASLAPQDTVIWFYETTIDGDLLNTATASGETTDGEDVTDDDTAEVNEVSPGIDIEKTPESQAVAYESDVTFTLTLTNTGDTSLADVVVTDALCDTLTFDGGDANGNNILETTETWTYTCEIGTVTEDFTNSADVVGNPVDENGNDIPGLDDPIDDDTADVDVLPNVNLTKDSATPVALGGSQFEITYTITVANTGAATTYDLNDVISFGAGTTIDSVMVTNTAPGTIFVNGAFDGDTDTEIVATEALAAVTTHTYQVVVTTTIDASDITATSGDCTIDAGETGTGFLNTATASVENADHTDDACEEFPTADLTIEKTVTSGPTLNGDGTYTIEYGISVVNVESGPTVYDLDDEFQFGEGMTVVSGAVANTAPGTITTNAAFDGVNDTNVVAGEAIVGGATHGYTVTAVVNAIGLVSVAAGDCTLGASETGTGFLNEATVSTAIETESDTACEEVPPPDINIAKAVASGPTLNTDGTYTVTYEIDVTNVGQGPGRYDLSDELTFGNNVTVDSASVANTTPGTITTDPAWDGDSNTGIVTGEALESGGTHTYTVTTTSTVAAIITETERDCTVDAGEDGTGFLNGATIAVEGVESDADACVEVPPANLNITKTIIDGPTVDAAGDYTITYELDVTNSGQGLGDYDLADELTFGEGITVDTATATNTDPGTIAINAAWDGIGTTNLVTDEAITAATTHTYEVNVTGNTTALPGETAGDCTIDSGETGTGFLNTATMSVDGTDSEAEACEPEPEPMLTIVKTVATGPTLGVDGLYTITYDVVVTNTGGSDTYDLTDELQFGDGITVSSASIANTTPGTIVTNPDWDGITDTQIVTDELITAGSTHSYLVTAVADALEVSAGTAGDCTVDQGENGTGFLNTTEITNDQGSMTDEDCVEVPDPSLTLTKTVASGPTLNDDGTYGISYTVVVENAGDGPGRYDLDDELTFGEGMVIDSASVSNLVPGTIDTNVAWDGIGTTSVVTDVAIPAQTTHSFVIDVVVDALLIAGPTAANCTVDQGEDGTGFLNTAMVDSEAGALEAEACEELPPPSINLTKILDRGPIDLGNGQYSLVYLLTITNAGGGPGTYDLTDEFNFGEGISIDSVALANPNPATLAINVSFDGDTDTSVLENQAIASAASHTVEIAVTATVAPSTLTSGRDCELGQGEDGTGFLNLATLDVDGTESEADACSEAPPAEISIDKSVTSGPTATGTDNEFEMVYDVTVTNAGSGPGEYDLTDELQFGTGITVVSAAVENTAPGTITADPAWDGEANLDIVSDEAIQGLQTHTYQVTVISTVDGATLTLASGDCSLDRSESGTGFLNAATVTFEDEGSTDDACETVPEPELTITKTIVGDPVLNADGSYTVTYEIDVSNSGEGPGSYDLADALAFSDAVTVTDATVANTTPGTIITNAAWDGDVDTSIVDNEAITAGDTHTYTVTTNSTVTTSVLNSQRDCSLGGGESGTGFLNTASLESEAGVLTGEDCGEIPPADINIDKTVIGDPIVTGTAVTVTYEISVSNDGDGPGSYDLTDELQFGQGITIDSATVTNTAPGTVATNPAWDGSGDTVVATDVGLAVGATDTYEVVVNATISVADLAPGANDCDLTDEEAGTGLFNTATASTEDGSEEAEACGEVPGPELEIVKDVVSGPTPTGDPNTYEVVYSIEVTNVGEGPGNYELTDTFAFADGVTVVSTSTTNTDPGTIATNADFDGATNSVIAADQLLAGESHTYEVTVVADVTNVHAIEAFDCSLDPGEDGTGFLNIAQVNPTDDACIEIPLISDLELQKVSNLSTVTIGDTLVWTITVENVGPADTTGVTVTDQLPSGVEFITSDGDFDAETGIWTVGDLAFGDTATLIIASTVVDFSNLTNVAEVETSDNDDPDSTPGNSDPAEDDQDEVEVIGKPNLASGTLWFDADADGVIDPVEQLLAGVTISLVDDDGLVIATTVTDGSGNYTFENLAPGTYTVVVDQSTLPEGLDIRTFEKDGVFDGRFTFTIEAGADETEIDYGYAQAPPILPKTGTESGDLIKMALALLLTGMALLVASRPGRKEQEQDGVAPARAPIAS